MKTNNIIIKSISIVVICFLFAFGTISNPKKIIVIDAGHGGKDFGVTTDAHFESILVEQISKKIKAINSDTDSFEIILLREGDIYMSLKDRVEKVNQIQPHLLLSLHINSSPNTISSGFEMYVAKNDGSYYEESLHWANKIYNHLTTSKLQSKEMQEASLFLLTKSNCAAVNLQLGYLTNEIDKKYLISEEGQNELAQKIIEALNE